MKKFIAKIAASVSVFLGAAVIFFWVVLPQPPSFKNMVKPYENNRADIEKVVDTLKALAFNCVGIYSTDEDYRHIWVYDSMPVETYVYEDDETYAAFQRLFNEQKCSFIDKKENYVYFQWWQTRDAACGIVCSLDGETPRMNEELEGAIAQSFALLGYENWYYYTYKWLGSQHS
jgi:hypothetical protein